MSITNKSPVFEWFYAEGVVYITVVTGRSNLLKIPQRFYSNKTETFVMGNTPTPDITYDETGIKTSMRFGNDLFHCFFPWECISVMSGPNAVIEFTADEKSKTGQSPLKSGKKKFPLNKKKKSSRDRSHLKVVK